MADVQSGLSGDDFTDVNSDAGFMAAVAKSAGVEVAEGQLEQIESRSTSVADGLTTEESARPRDEQGRFIPTAPPVADEGAAPASGDDQGVGLDPEISDYVTRHGGDANAALAAALKEAREAQSLIGRQGNDLGAERQARQELAEKVARLEGAVMAQRQPDRLPLVNTDEIEAVQTMVAERGGHAAMQYILGDGVNRPDLIDHVLKAWELDEPVAAAGWNARYQTHLAHAELQAAEPAAAVATAAAADHSAVADLAHSLDTVKASMPAGEWELVRERLTPLLDDPTTPEVIKTAVVSPDADTQVQGLTGLVKIAKARAISEVADKAAAEHAEKSRQAKLSAGVATGSLRPVLEPAAEGGAQTREQAMVAFRDALLSTETTSVRDGLTFGS